MKNLIGPEIIILHCSATDSPEFDCVSRIREMHIKERGFEDIGYHYFIKKNGGLQEGRPIQFQGAHCSGNNFNSIGICLSGLKLEKFQTAQFITLGRLLYELQKRYKISDDKIFPHHHFDEHKDCPVYTMEMALELKKAYRGK